MDVKTYNKVIAPRLYSARGFLGAVNNALEKSGPEAARQMRIIGWNDEMKEFLLKALNALERAEKSKLEMPMPYIDAVKLVVLAANNGILRRDKGNVTTYRNTDGKFSLNQEDCFFQPINKVAEELISDSAGQRYLIEKLKEKGIDFSQST